MQYFLKQISLGPLQSQYIVFFVVPQFRHTYRARDVFIWDSFGKEPEYQSLLDVSSTLRCHDGDRRYDLLLTEFFSNPSRSGPFYLDGNKYASFAITFTKYLIS